MIEADLERDLRALMDSVSLINSILAQEILSDEDLDTLDRNVCHIEIMLAKEHIAQSGEDLTVFVDAVIAGKK